MDDWQEKVRAIEASGISRGDLADKVGCAYSTLSDVASGATKEPRGMTAVRIHELYLALIGAAGQGGRSAQSQAVA